MRELGDLQSGFSCYEIQLAGEFFDESQGIQEVSWAALVSAAPREAVTAVEEDHGVHLGRKAGFRDFEPARLLAIPALEVSGAFAKVMGKV